MQSSSQDSLIHHPLDLEAKKRSQARLVVKQAETPDYDNLFPCQILASDHYKRMAIPLSRNVGDGQAVETKITGRLLVFRGGRGGMMSKTTGNPLLESVLIRHGYGKADNLKAFTKSAKWGKSKAMEAFGIDDEFSIGAYPNAFNSANNEFIPLQGGPYNKQLYLTDYLEMWAKCYEAKNHNPLAKRAVDVITNYVMGKGVTMKFTDPDVQAVWDAYEKRTKFQQRRRMDCDTLTWGGEIMTHKTVNAAGLPTPKQLDPSGVVEIVTDPTDITIPYYFHQQFPTQYQQTYKPGDIASEFVINDIPASEVIHTKINCVPGEKRGRSDLFPVLGWLKAFKDYYTASIAKEQLAASYAWDFSIEGSQADVDGFSNDTTWQQTPPPGSSFFHNKSVERTIVSAAGSTGGRAQDSVGEAIRSIIATGIGISPEELGVGGAAATRATALVKADGSTKKFEDRQQVMEWDIDQEVEWFMDVHPKLRGKKFDRSYEVMFPEISKEDRSAKLKDLAMAMATKAIDHKTYSTIVAGEFDITNYDYEETKKNIAEDDKDKAIQMSMSLPPTQQLWQPGSPQGAAGGAKPPAKPGSMADNKSFKQASAQDKGD